MVISEFTNKRCKNIFKKTLNPHVFFQSETMCNFLGQYSYICTVKVNLFLSAVFTEKLI